MDDKVALVTGAAMGIGEGIARRFVDAGARVAMFDIDGEALTLAAARMRAPEPVLTIAGDVSRDEDARRAVSRTVDAFGRLDILVNNAGIDLSGPVTEFCPDEWDRLLAVNLKGAYLFARHAIPHMQGRGGAVVNISSVHALVSFAGSPAYDAAKAGLLGLTRTLAIDHGPDGIRANAICPGYVDTPMTRKWLDSLPNKEAVLRQVESYHPVGRIGTAADIAEAALFLASDSSTFITGATLVVDGGLTICGR
ncbi:MAG TPA: SDR family oxidoreductase [Bryobacteraceae bacterium]|nr:SDR family oxidoreductase [Bryobacteraceae bacterium]